MDYICILQVIFNRIFGFPLPDVQAMIVEDDASLRKNYAALKEETDVGHEKRAQGVLPFVFM